MIRRLASRLGAEGELATESGELTLGSMRIYRPREKSKLLLNQTIVT